MVFEHFDAVNARIQDDGNEIDLYTTPTDFTTIRAIITVVDSTKADLLKIGLRPQVDLVVYLVSTQEVSTGQKVVWNSTQYEVTAVEAQYAGTAVTQNKLLLKLIGPVGMDLDT